MAIGKKSLGNVASLNLYIDEDSNGTAETNITAGVPTVYQWQVDNTLNSAASYSKGWDNAAPTVGTTAPNWIIPAPSGQRVTMIATKSVGGGAPMQTALSVATVTAPGTAGTTGPTSDVELRIAAV